MIVPKRIFVKINVVNNKTNVNNLSILALKDIYDIKYAASNKPEIVHDIPSKI